MIDTPHPPSASHHRTALLPQLEHELEGLKSAGLYKRERQLATPQGAEIQLADGRKAINFCANNYLGLASHETIVAAAHSALDSHGFGLASVRFICGTQDIHKQLEARIARFVGLDDAILYSSCFDANGGLFETLFGEEDAIISDALNHASIIDGVRLSKAQRFRYANNDMADLEAQLKAASSARHRLIATDGVFSMDGSIANLKGICDLADAYGAWVMVDDSHAVGFIGDAGRGTAEHCGVLGRVDIITGTLGKALGGAAGGYTAARGPIVEWLRQRSRPYLFSNTVAPPIVGAALATLELLEQGDALRVRLRANARRFRAGLTRAGFTLLPGEHPIIPVMLGDAKLATDMADQLLAEGIYVIGFSFPVVPRGLARIRTQISAAHTDAQIDHAIAAFETVGRRLGVLKSA